MVNSNIVKWSTHVHSQINLDIFLGDVRSPYVFLGNMPQKSMVWYSTFISFGGPEIPVDVCCLYSELLSEQQISSFAPHTHPRVPVIWDVIPYEKNMVSFDGLSGLTGRFSGGLCTASSMDCDDESIKVQNPSCGYSNVINHLFLMVGIPPIKMVMNGGWCMTLLYQYYRSTWWFITQILNLWSAWWNKWTKEGR